VYRVERGRVGAVGRGWQSESVVVAHGGMGHMGVVVSHPGRMRVMGPMWDMGVMSLMWDMGVVGLIRAMPVMRLEWRV